MSMEATNTETKEKTERIARRVLELGRKSIEYAHVERAPRYTEGRRENDAEHSQMLVTVAVYLASEYYPDLDQGLIALFAAIHDYPEIYTGDVPTLGISDEDREAKELAEAASTLRLIAELPEPWSSLLKRYEEQTEPEARFVRLVDKLLPIIVQIYGDGRRTFKENYGITSREQLDKIYKVSTKRFKRMFPEYKEILDLREVMTVLMNDEVFGAVDAE